MVEQSGLGITSNAVIGIAAVSGLAAAILGYLLVPVDLRPAACARGGSGDPGVFRQEPPRRQAGKAALATARRIRPDGQSDAGRTDDDAGVPVSL